MILETNRLILREMTQADYPALCLILQDPIAMVAYERAFSDEEVRAWLDNQLRRYREDSFGLWAVALKESGEMIGQCGLTLQDTPDGRVVEVGYLFQRAFWHQGYATEAAIACKNHAFDALGVDEVFSIIRDTNIASQNVAIRNGMGVRGSFVKHYRGVDMPHLLYSARRGERYRNVIGRETLVVIDRPLGSTHPKYEKIVYPVNYGYIEGVKGGDGSEQDIYLLGVDVPVERHFGRVIAVIHRLDDVEDKWVVAPEGVGFTKEQIVQMTDFQERFFRIEVYI